MEMMGSDIYLHDYIPQVIAAMNETYPGFAFRHCCDYAGMQARPGGCQDKYGNIVSSEVEVLRSFGIQPQFTPSGPEKYGLGVIQRYIQIRGGIGIHPHCHTVISILSGALQFATDINGRIKEHTRDDDYLEHIADTLRYFALNVLVPSGLGGTQPVQANYPRYGDEGTQLEPARPWYPGDWSMISIPVRK